MPRPIWSGTLSFGLVSVPVRLYTATENRDVRFHNFQKGTGERVRHKRVAEGSGDEVAYEDIVKGYEVRPGEHVMVEPEELEAVEPGRSRSIEIEDFVDLGDVDPVHFRRTYHVMPSDEGAARPYTLLRTALDDADRVGVARFVMRGKQHLAAVRVMGDVLALETMYFPDEVRDPAQLKERSWTEGIEVNDRELEAAHQLIDSLTTEWDPTNYHDTYRERVLELLERKAEGESVVREQPEEPGGEVVDLMAALERSIEEARHGRRARTDGHSAGDRADGRRPASSGAGGNGFASMTRDELYEEAQRRDISGRSKMSKDELIGALQEAS